MPFVLYKLVFFHKTRGEKQAIGGTNMRLPWSSMWRHYFYIWIRGTSSPKFASVAYFWKESLHSHSFPRPLPDRKNDNKKKVLAISFALTQRHKAMNRGGVVVDEDGFVYSDRLSGSCRPEEARWHLNHQVLPSAHNGVLLGTSLSSEFWYPQPMASHEWFGMISAATSMSSQYWQPSTKTKMLVAQESCWF